MSEFEKSFEKNKRVMYLAARKIGARHELAEDCVQEAARKLSQMDTIKYMDENSVKGLFCETTRNEVIDHLRSERDSKKREKNWSQVEGLTKARKGEKKHAIALTVHKALSRLSELERYVIWKYLALEFSMREIIEDLKVEKGISMYRIEMLRFIHKTTKKLRKELISMGGDPR